MSAPLQISMEPTPQASGLARSVLEAAFSDSMPAVALWDLKTIVSELVANSCKHGPGEPIHLSIHPDAGSRLLGEVEDGGDEAFDMEEITDAGGLGLHIVNALADNWVVANDGGSVRFTLDTDA